MKSEAPIQKLMAQGKNDENKIKTFRDLRIWQQGQDIVLQVYKATRVFPKDELYGLTSQMRRASVSIVCNIAEGFNRFHNKEYRQFLYISLGSCAELETQIEIAVNLQYLDQFLGNTLLELLDHEAGMLRNLIKRL